MLLGIDGSRLEPAWHGSLNEDMEFLLLLTSINFNVLYIR